MLVSYVKAIKITIKSVLLGRDRSNGTDFLMLWHLVTGLTRRRLGYKGCACFEFQLFEHSKQGYVSIWKNSVNRDGFAENVCILRVIITNVLHQSGLIVLHMGI